MSTIRDFVVGVTQDRCLEAQFFIISGSTISIDESSCFVASSECHKEFCERRFEIQTADRLKALGPHHLLRARFWPNIDAAVFLFRWFFSYSLGGNLVTCLRLTNFIQSPSDGERVYIEVRHCCSKDYYFLKTRAHDCTN